VPWGPTCRSVPRGQSARRRHGPPAQRASALEPAAGLTAAVIVKGKGKRTEFQVSVRVVSKRRKALGVVS
jgi:hypothetical protein